MWLFVPMIFIGTNNHVFQQENCFFFPRRNRPKARPPPPKACQKECETFRHHSIVIADRTGRWLRTSKLSEATIVKSWPMKEKRFNPNTKWEQEHMLHPTVVTVPRIKDFWLLRIQRNYRNSHKVKYHNSMTK